MAARSAMAAALACALLATAQAQSNAQRTGIQRASILSECFYGGKNYNLLKGGKPGGKCLFTAEFERYYDSLSGKRCRGFRDCAGVQKGVAKLPGTKGKRIKLNKIGMCGEIDAGAGSVAFAFRGDKGTTPWSVQAGQPSYPYGKKSGTYGKFERYDFRSTTWDSGRCGDCEKASFPGYGFRMGATASGSNTKMEFATADLATEASDFKFAGKQEVFFAFKDGESVVIDSLGNRDPDNRYCATDIKRPNGETLNVRDRPGGRGTYGTWRPIIDYMYQCTPKAALTDATCDRCDNTKCLPKDGNFVSEKCDYSVDDGFLSVTKQPVCGKCGPKCEEGNYEVISCGNYKPSKDTGVIDGGQGRVCGPMTKCQEGYTFEIKKGTATSDRLCAPVTRCVLGYEIETVKPTVTSDRKCIAVTKCGLDEFETKPASATANPTCQKALVCKDSEYETQALSKTADRKCADIKKCSKGSTYETKAPTATENRECARLTPACDTSAGVAEVVQATATSDRKCAQCEAGTYLDILDGTCKPVTKCGMEKVEDVKGDGKLWRPKTLTVKSEAAATKDAVCESLEYTCHSGYFSEAAGAPDDCEECKACKEDEVMVSSCTTTTNRVCQTLQKVGALLEEEAEAVAPKIEGIKGNLVINRPLFIQGSEMSVAQGLANIKAQQEESARLNDDLQAIAMHAAAQM